MSQKYYTKNPNGRYEEIGEPFEGFPADGWWIVADGKQVGHLRCKKWPPSCYLQSKTLRCLSYAVCASHQIAPSDPNFGEQSWTEAVGGALIQLRNKE